MRCVPRIRAAQHARMGRPLTDEELAKLDTLGSEEYRRQLLAEMKAGS